MDVLRRRLLGLQGPYADIREATDQLDNVKLWINGLEESDRKAAFSDLHRLIIDDNLEIATVAVLSLDFVSEYFDSEAAAFMLLENDARLYRQPLRMGATTFKTILQEYFSRVCKYCTGISHRCLEDFLLRTAEPLLRSSLLSFLAPNYSSLVVYHAHRMLDYQDAQVIAALPNHWGRIAVATALRPWPLDAVDRVKSLLRIRKFNEHDTEAIVKVMADDAPRLTHPAGLKDSRRWWIIAGEPYSWTMWETNDGELAFEVLHPGPGFQSTSRILSPSEAIAFRQNRSLGSSLL